MFDYNDAYKNNLLSNIKNYLSIFDKELKINGKIEYVTCNNKNDPAQYTIAKVVKCIAMLWGIIIIAVSAYIIYTEVIVPLNVSISLRNYIIAVVLFTLIIITLILINIKYTKQIYTITATPNNLTICLLNSNKQAETENTHIYRYDLNKINFAMRRQRKNSKGALRNNNFNIYVTYKNKKTEYNISVGREEEFFMFLIFLESFFNGMNISELTDDKLYKMYHTRRYGLKFKRK